MGPNQESTDAAARSSGADEIQAERQQGPGLLSRIPGMAYQCRNDRDWTMEFVSSGALKLTGYEASDLLGPGFPTYADVIHPEDRERVWTEVQRSVTSNEPYFDIRYRIAHRDGSVRDVWERGHPVYSPQGELLGLEGFITDITELEHTKRSLSETEVMVRALVEQGLVGVYMIQDGVFRYVNPAFAEIFGYRVNEIVGQLSPVDLAAPEDRKTVESRIRSRMSGKTASVRYEFTGLRKDGTTIRVEVHGSRVELGGRSIIAGVLIDQSEQRALEDQLRHAQRVEGLGELTGAIAHDFNNYLTAIIAPIELALKDAPDEAPFRDELMHARQTASQAAGLTQQLLSFGRRRVRSPQPLYLNDLLENLEKMLRRLIGARIEIHLSLGADLPPILGDRSHLQQVVVNLIVNARDAMPDGGSIYLETGTTTIEPDEARRRNDLEPGAYVTLTVRDEGHGMEESVAKQIFDPYFTTKDSGTGLGLSTVFGIVRQHGGDVAVATTQGVGTKFTLLLPATDREPEGRNDELDRAGLDDQATYRGRGILLVEDESAVRRATMAALQRFGYTVYAAADGEEALEMFSAHEPQVDLLLTDMGLPKMTGPDIAEAIENLRPDIPVLFMSGHASEDVLNQVDHLSTFRFLEKPFMIDDLLDAVQQTLESSLDGGS